MREDKSSAEYMITTYVTEINRLNNELRDSRIGNRKVKSNDNNNGIIMENFQDNAEYLHVNALYEPHDIDDPLENYGFSKVTGHYGYTNY